MSYINKIKKHLSEYKVKNFPDLEDGIWRNNKQEYSHILPENNKFDNFLSSFKKELVNYVNDSKTELDSSFHHLNSSQAMCLNFFYPLYYERKLELVTEFLGLKNKKVNYDTVCFEKRGLENNYGRVPTCFDFYFETNTKMKIYFEIKYTEPGFGKAKPNLDKFDNVYSKYLTSINKEFHEKKSFYKDFQILRNLIHIDEDSYVVFVYPLENKTVKREVDKVKTKFLNSDYLNHFYAAEWNNLFEYISKEIEEPKLQKQFEEFKNKYLP